MMNTTTDTRNHLQSTGQESSGESSQSGPQSSYTVDSALTAGSAAQAAFFAEGDLIGNDLSHRCLFFQGGGRVEIRAHEPELVARSGHQYITQEYSALYYRSGTDSQAFATVVVRGTTRAVGALSPRDVEDIADGPQECAWQECSWEVVPHASTAPRSSVLMGSGADDLFLSKEEMERIDQKQRTADAQLGQTHQLSQVHREADILIQHMATLNTQPGGTTSFATYESHAQSAPWRPAHVALAALQE